MNDTVETTVSSLAVVEKKPQRPGGCVGIFFQLFDWNRRFAKKKIFSKKLLPPVRFKQASKKFGGDEKQPKLRLIADENSGGFPTSKNSKGASSVENEPKNETLVPGLVARLMGLDSMPTSQREKPKKLPQSASVRGKVGNGEELNVEEGGIKHELRPQKLQKTSISERQPMTKFGAEKMPFKNVLSKSRKRHTVLPSPVKSPRNLSRKRSSKLIGAAARILEPGLQTSRSKCALTYSNTLRHPPQETRIEEKIHSRQLEDCEGFGTVAANEELSCRNCGYALNDTNCTQRLDFASPFLNCVGPSCSERTKPEFYQELEGELHEEYPDRSPYTGQIQRHRQNQMLRVRERVPPRPNINNLMNGKASTTVMDGAKCSVSTNQSLSCSTRQRVPTRTDNGRFGLEKRITNSMNDLAPPGRKRRPNNISRQGENSGFTMSGKQLGYDSHFINRQKGRVGLVQGQDRTFNCSPGGNNVVSFTLDYPVKKNAGTHVVAERRVKTGLCCDESLKKSASGEISSKTKFEKPCPISGDALGAILEQKLNELNSQRDDMGIAPKKTTAIILQELITALTSEANAMGIKLCIDQLDNEHLSPGSVLETNVSCESCPFSTVDDSPGYKMLNESLDTAESCKELVINILNNVSEILSCSNLTFNLKGTKLDQAKEVLLNAELFFHGAGRTSPIKRLLLEEWEMLASLLWMNFGCSLGVENGKDVNRIRTFVLDSIVEYLGVKFRGYPKLSRKLPLRVDNSMLVFEIVEVVRRWEAFSRLGIDEAIETEMGLSLGEWTECESEGFEIGVEISRHFLQILVDEFVMDLWKW